MTQAKIELRVKELYTINPSLDVPGEITFYHAYIVHTTSTGEQYILRGGPNGVTGNPLTSNVRVVGVDTPLTYGELNNEAHNDWPSFGQNVYSSSVATGTDAEIDALMSTMRAEGSAINAGNYAYGMTEHNSNTVVHRMLSAAGLSTPNLVDPLNGSGHQHMLPGFNNNLSHDGVDDFFHSFHGLLGVNANDNDLAGQQIVTAEGQTFTFQLGDVFGDLIKSLGWTDSAGDADIQAYIQSNADNFYLESRISEDGSLMLLKDGDEARLLAPGGSQITSEYVVELDEMSGRIEDLKEVKQPNGTILTAGQVGSIFGSQAAAFFAGSGFFEQVGARTVGSVIGEEVGSLISDIGGSILGGGLGNESFLLNGTGSALTKLSNLELGDLGRFAHVQLQPQAANVIDTYLIAEVGEALGMDGFAANDNFDVFQLVSDNRNYLLT